MDGKDSKKVNKDELIDKFLLKLNTESIFKNIKKFGGYNNVVNMAPNFFSENKNKIKLIKEIVDFYEPDGLIYFYELQVDDIKIWEEEIEDGHTIEEYINCVGDESVGVTVWEYDEDGDMYDEEREAYYIKLGKLPDVTLNKVFEILVSYYL